MKTLDERIAFVKREMVDHAQCFPGHIDSWRSKFDELRADLERLQFARSHVPPTTERQEL